jgi:hypothetical protein
MFWKKKKPKMRELEITTHIREFLYDSQFKEADALAVILGAPVISEELMDKEFEQSDLRIDKISHLIPLVHTYAHLMSDGMVKLERGEADREGDEFTDEFWEMMRVLLEQISMSLTIGVVSQLNQLELIKVKAP